MVMNTRKIPRLDEICIDHSIAEKYRDRKGSKYDSGYNKRKRDLRDSRSKSNHKNDHSREYTDHNSIQMHNISDEERMKEKNEIHKLAERVRGDWSEHVSRSGKRYFYNSRTESSQWDRPKEWSLDSPTPPPLLSKSPERSKNYDKPKDKHFDRSDLHREQNPTDIIRKSRASDASDRHRTSDSSKRQTDSSERAGLNTDYPKRAGDKSDYNSARTSRGETTSFRIDRNDLRSDRGDAHSLRADSDLLQSSKNSVGGARDDKKADRNSRRQVGSKPAQQSSPNSHRKSANRDRRCPEKISSVSSEPKKPKDAPDEYSASKDGKSGTKLKTMRDSPELHAHSNARRSGSEPEVLEGIIRIISDGEEEDVGRREKGGRENEDVDKVVDNSRCLSVTAVNGGGDSKAAVYSKVDNSICEDMDISPNVSPLRDPRTQPLIKTPRPPNLPHQSTASATQSAPNTPLISTSAKTTAPLMNPLSNQNFLTSLQQSVFQLASAGPTGQGMEKISAAQLGFLPVLLAQLSMIQQNGCLAENQRIIQQAIPLLIRLQEMLVQQQQQRQLQQRQLQQLQLQQLLLQLLEMQKNKTSAEHEAESPYSPPDSDDTPSSAQNDPKPITLTPSTPTNLLSANVDSGHKKSSRHDSKRARRILATDSESSLHQSISASSTPVSSHPSPILNPSFNDAQPQNEGDVSGLLPLATIAKPPEGFQLSVSLSKYSDQSLTAHVQQWQADDLDRQAEKYRIDNHALSSVIIAQLLIDLKKARSVIRSQEILSTLSEQRVISLRQELVDLERTQPPASSAYLAPLDF